MAIKETYTVRAGLDVDREAHRVGVTATHLKDLGLSVKDAAARHNVHSQRVLRFLDERVYQPAAAAVKRVPGKVAELKARLPDPRVSSPPLPAPSR